MLLELLKMIKTEKVVQIQGNQGRQEKTLKSSQEVRYFTNANLDTVFQEVSPNFFENMEKDKSEKSGGFSSANYKKE